MEFTDQLAFLANLPPAYIELAAIVGFLLALGAVQRGKRREFRDELTELTGRLNVLEACEQRRTKKSRNSPPRNMMTTAGLLPPEKDLETKISIAPYDIDMTPTLPLSIPKGATVQGGISQFESKSRTDTTVELIEAVSTNIARLRGCRDAPALLILDSPRDIYEIACAA